MENSEMTYSQAYDELRRIMSCIEQGGISVDELTENISKASQLIAFCKEKLHKIELDTDKLLEDLEQSNA
ncbi:MAG: exodeoxyribonuclease VII small subunit [Bacteroidales bacterium]|nr:exodeoxyribonuclease VII small subunit [Bacteroidales bacterium]MBQ7984144.1 exodeoxyribonuclease VII small subunit [Bacteroidales bacterium]